MNRTIELVRNRVVTDLGLDLHADTEAWDAPHRFRDADSGVDIWRTFTGEDSNSDRLVRLGHDDGTIRVWVFDGVAQMIHAEATFYGVNAAAVARFVEPFLITDGRDRNGRIRWEA